VHRLQLLAQCLLVTHVLDTAPNVNSGIEESVAECAPFGQRCGLPGHDIDDFMQSVTHTRAI